MPKILPAEKGNSCSLTGACWTQKLTNILGAAKQGRWLWLLEVFLGMIKIPAWSSRRKGTSNPEWNPHLHIEEISNPLNHNSAWRSAGTSICLSYSPLNLLADLRVTQFGSTHTYEQAPLPPPPAHLRGLATAEMVCREPNSSEGPLVSAQCHIWGNICFLLRKF